MKGLMLSLVIVLSFSTVLAQNSKLEKFYREIKNLNVTTINEYPPYQNLIDLVKYIALGKPNPNSFLSTIGISGLIDFVPGDFTIGEILIIVSQTFYAEWVYAGYDDSDFIDFFEEWKVVLNKFLADGAFAVNFDDLRPFIKLLTPGNLYNTYRKLYDPVKNAKQYLNEEFLAKIKNPYCRNYVGLWFQDILEGKDWALKMFDLIGKPPANLLNGNTNWLGGYKTCRKIEVYFNKDTGFHGKYCRTTLGIPMDLIPDFGIPLGDNFGINIGWCVPNQCDRDDVFTISELTLKLASIYPLVNVKNVFCDEPIPYDNAFIAITVLLSIIALLVVSATVFDGIERTRKAKINEDLSQTAVEAKIKITGSGVIEENNYRAPETTKSNPIIQFLFNCSLYKNSERLLRTDNGGKFACLNGIRTFSIVWIICSHTLNYLADFKQFFLLSNALELKDIEETPVAQVIIGGMYGVDTFFVMSAFLLTYSILTKLEKNNRLTPFEWVYYYVHRYWRLLPPYAIIIAIYICIMPFVGNGPLWETDNFPHSRKDCVNYWWAYLLMLNNFIPGGKGATCMGYLWYVPNDYQLYAISPIFLFLLFRYPLAGIVLLVFAMMSSIAILSFLTENVFNSQNRIILTTLQSIWEDVYIKPYCRAGPWVIGILLAYIFFKYKKITLPKLVVALGWCTSTVLALTAVFGGFTNHDPEGRRMRVEEYGAYFAITRVTFGLSVSWVIFACHYGYAGVINRILSAKIFIPFARISYCSYLIHPVIMNAYLYSQDGLFHGNGMTLLYIVLGNIVFTFAIAFFYSLFFEQPFIAVEKLVLSGRKVKSDD